MRVNREALLKALESVAPGLAPKEVLEQSSCVVFHEGRICTFNDEVFCSTKSPLGDFTGAITAKPLLDLLSKLQEDEIEIEPGEGEIKIKGKGRRAGIRMEAQVLLPVDSVEIPDVWKPLPSEFSEAISVVHTCASTDESKFVLTCVHLTPSFIEACDQFQIARFPIEINIEKPMLVRAVSLAKMMPLGMIEISETPAWLHFRNASGLVLSCRRFLDEYVKLDKFLETEAATKVTLPGGLEEVVSKAEIFTSENSIGNHLQVSIRDELLEIKGDGASGWYQERKQVTYDGPPIKFNVAPKLLLAISKKSNECCIEPGRLLINTGRFRYVTCTIVAAEKKDR